MQLYIFKQNMKLQNIHLCHGELKCLFFLLNRDGGEL